MDYCSSGQMCADDYTPTPTHMHHTNIYTINYCCYYEISICFLVENRQLECSKSLINQEAYDKQ